MRLLSLVLLSLSLSQAATASPGCVASTDRRPVNYSGTARTLQVVLYPFIPGFDSLKNEVKARFEKAHPDIQLDIIDLSDNYYGPFVSKFIGCTEADVYELDSVFLHDFVLNKKIQELPAEAALPPGSLLKNAVLGSTVNGKRYGAPHWVCGNFLFFDASDSKLQGVKTLTELMRVLGSQPKPDNG